VRSTAEHLTRDKVDILSRIRPACPYLQRIKLRKDSRLLRGGASLAEAFHHMPDPLHLVV